MKKYIRKEPEASQLRCDKGDRMQEGNQSQKQHRQKRTFQMQLRKAEVMTKSTTAQIKAYANDQKEYLVDGPKWRMPRRSLFQVEKECLRAAASVSKPHKSNILKNPNDEMNTNLRFETLEARNIAKFASLNEDEENTFCESRKLDINVLEKKGNKNNFDEFSHFDTTVDESIMFPEKNNENKVRGGNALLNRATTVSETRNDFYGTDGGRDQKEVTLDYPDIWKNPYNFFEDNEKIIKPEIESSIGNLHISVPFSRSVEDESMCPQKNIDDNVRSRKNAALFNENTTVSKSETRYDFYRTDNERYQEEAELDYPDAWKYPCDNLFPSVHKDKKIIKLEKEESMFPPKSNDDKVRPRKNFTLFNEETTVSKSETRNDFYSPDNWRDQEEAVELDYSDVWKFPCDNLFASLHKDKKETIKQEKDRSIGNLQNSVPFRPVSNEEGFSNCQLRDLLHYDISFMQGQQLFSYAVMLKHRISEKILEIKYPVNEELRFLCAITDGNQTERNQRLITARMCHVLNQVIETHPHILNTQDLKQPYEEPDFKNSDQSEMQHFPRSSSFQTSSYSSVVSDNLISNSPLKSNLSVSDSPLFSNCPLPSQILTQQISESENKNYSSKSFEKLNSNMPLDTAKYSSILNENSVGQNFNSTAVLENGNFVDRDYSDKLSSLDSALDVESDLPMPIAIKVENGFKEHSGYNDNQVQKTKKSPLVRKPCLADEDSTFCHFSLENLLNYDLELMHGDSLSDYAFSMKEKVKQNIHLFDNHMKKKLEFLCELTDGTQTEPNQKLITARMCRLITNFYSYRSHNQNRNKLTKS